MKDLSLNTTEALVFIKGSEPVTTSLKIAEVFEKQHSHVLEAIDSTLSQVPDIFKESTFRESEYTQVNSLGLTVPYRMYEMTEEGAMLIIMGFTGARAMETKVRFITAFKEMREELSRLKSQSRIEHEVKTITSTSEWLKSFMPGIDTGLMAATVLREIETITGTSTENLRRLLPGIPTDIPANNASAIGEKLGMTATRINKLLAAAGLQFKNAKDAWELTIEGAQYGSMIPFSKNGHSGFQISWKNSLIEMLVERGLVEA